MREDFLWVEKYRPKTIADTILPAELKATFQQFVDQGNIPNLILAGSAGVGKTTVARAMLEQAVSTVAQQAAQRKARMSRLLAQGERLPGFDEETSEEF